MTDNNAFGNALVAAVVRQRDEALNKSAQAEATIVVLEADNARLAAENAKPPRKSKK